MASANITAPARARNAVVIASYARQSIGNPPRCEPVEALSGAEVGCSAHLRSVSVRRYRLFRVGNGGLQLVEPGRLDLGLEIVDHRRLRGVAELLQLLFRRLVDRHPLLLQFGDAGGRIELLDGPA